MSHRFGPRTRTSSSSVMQWGQSSVVSVQRGTVLVDTNQTTGTATITAVQTAHARLRYLGASCVTGNAAANIANARIALTNGTTITATRNTADATATVTVSFEVTEYLPGVIKSVQRGTVVVGTPATITEVLPAKTDLDWLGFISSDTAANSNQTALMPKIVLTNGTTITATNGGGSVTETSGYQAVEWN